MRINRRHDLLPLRLAARALGVSRQMVSKMIDRGELGAEQFGSHVGVYRDEVEALARARAERRIAELSR